MCRSAGCAALLVALAACGPGTVGPDSRMPIPAPASAASATPADPIRFGRELVAATMQQLGDDGVDGVRIRTSRERAQLEALYPADAAVALWLDSSGRPTDDARDALALLAGADAQGLDPDDYRTPPPEPPAAFDIALSLQVMRYWRDLHLGRVDPRSLGFRLNAPIDDHDFPAMLRDALTGHRIGAATDELVPPLVLYRSLVTALARYRELAPRAQPVMVPTPPRSFKPGDAVAGLASLRERLVLVGDMPADAEPPGEVYAGAIVDGVKRFQVRHGLDPDGALGRATLAALQVPLTTRLQQLELALERLRWLPHLSDEGFLAVNIPMFRLWAWGRVPPDGSPAFDMGVVVGRALDTQTPVFIDQMEYLIFRPYWNVPPSILRHETLPAMVKDQGYLARNGMEIVAGDGDDAATVPLSAESLGLLRQGRLRVRQRPGPGNSLGLVKFVFPNDENIYMHGTPARQLFARARRDFSHGCIRLEDPVKLAEWVLRDQPEWTRERILQAMEGPSSQRVKLSRPIQVILFYLTAVVIPEDRSVHFADDIYGHDRRLARALGMNE